MILKRVTFSSEEKENNNNNNNNKKKKMSLGKKITLIGGISAGIPSLTAAGICYHNHRQVNQFQKKMKDDMKNANNALKNIYNKQRELEEKKAKALKDLKIKNIEELDDFMLK